MAHIKETQSADPEAYYTWVTALPPHENHLGVPRVYFPYDDTPVFYSRSYHWGKETIRLNNKARNCAIATIFFGSLTIILTFGRFLLH